MGKKILQQRRGRGTKLFQASLNKIAPARYAPLTTESSNRAVFKVVDLVHEAARGVPLTKLAEVTQKSNENPKIHYLPAIEGIAVGQTITYGSEATLNPGNVLPLKALPESTIICNLELRPGDGGALCRASGTYATIKARTPTYAVIELPSGRIQQFNLNCRATVGVIAGGGRTEKPFLKAGKKLQWKTSRAKLGKYPIVRGSVMNHHTHPYGGAGKHPHKPTTTSRHAPPGRKVGLIAARRTGRRKGKITDIQQGQTQ